MLILDERLFTALYQMNTNDGDFQRERMWFKYIERVAAY